MSKLVEIKKGKYSPNHFYLCECDCGNRVKRSLSALISGKTSDCGCGETERRSQASRSKAKKYLVSGRRVTVVQGAKIFTIDVETIRWRLQRGRHPQQAFTTPKQNTNLKQT